MDGYDYYFLIMKRFGDWTNYFQAGLQNLVGKIIMLNSSYKKIVMANDAKNY